MKGSKSFTTTVVIAFLALVGLMFLPVSGMAEREGDSQGQSYQENEEPTATQNPSNGSESP